MLKLSKFIEFNTEKQKYIYDSITSIVIEGNEVIAYLIENYFTNASTYIAMKEKFNLSEYEYNKIKKYVTSLIYNYNMFCYDEENCYNSELTIDEVKELTYTTPLSQLILIVTEDCNLRCEYCIYSDKYPKDIVYKPLKMNFEIAKGAIDTYFEMHRERKKHGLNKEANISFYGGEPLLNFDLIKRTVEYVKNIDPNTIFYITTNGTIMNNEIAEFIATNNFIVTFSLDGYKDNHDRNRVNINNEKTFDTILRNIKRLQKARKEAQNSNPISFNCCYDLYTDLEKVIGFFEQHYNEFDPFFITYAPIKQYDTTYYKWCDERYKNNEIYEKGIVFKSRDNIENKLLYEENISNEYQKVAAPLFLGELSYYIRSKNNEHGILRNSCLPLSKMAVTPEGKIVLCEKICEKYPVGDVKNGIDWDEVTNITNKLIRFFNSKKCFNCKAKALCEVCFIYLEDDGSINEEFCVRKRNNFEKELEHHYKLYEDGVDLISILKDNKDNILKIKEVSS